MWVLFSLLGPDLDPLTWLNPDPLRIRIRDTDFNKWWVRIRNFDLTIVGCAVCRDPVQLNLLYEQAKEQILEGTHPVEIDKAITFAAYQVRLKRESYEIELTKMRCSAA